MGDRDVLFALLGREPVFLLPELSARGHAWACKPTLFVAL